MFSIYAIVLVVNIAPHALAWRRIYTLPKPDLFSDVGEDNSCIKRAILQLCAEDVGKYVSVV
jgi:hypothetical protein